MRGWRSSGERYGLAAAPQPLRRKGGRAKTPGASRGRQGPDRETPGDGGLHGRRRAFKRLARGVDVGVADAEVEKLAEWQANKRAGTDRIAEAEDDATEAHFAGTRNAFWARAPYRHAPKPPTTRKTHVCRFVALGKAALSKDPQRKWIHAVDIDPVPYAPLQALQDEPINCQDSPYLCFQSSERPVEKLAKRPVEDTDRGAFRWASVAPSQAPESRQDS